MDSKAALARLQRAPWLKSAQPFFACLDGASGKTRAVGGIVRDTLLGLKDARSDIDLASELTPEIVEERGRAAGMSVYPTGADHGTMTLVHGGCAAEVTTLRRDMETFGRKAKVVFGTDWVEDARRRDFTMNALYCGQDGALFDPLGGLDDCLAGRVLFIGDPDTRIVEDKLRVYRYFRFVVSHGNQQFDDAAIAACGRAAGSLAALSAERVGREMTRLLAHRYCAATVSQMAALDILPAKFVSPQALVALGQLERYSASRDGDMRIALMGMSGAELARLRQNWRLSNKTMARVDLLTSAARLARKGKIAELVYRYRSEWSSGLVLAAALEGKNEDWLTAQLAIASAFYPGHFPLSGADLVSKGYRPGPALGAELKRLETLWIASIFGLDREALLALCRPADDQ
ncbi:CCA tRNA nucleotidyltransferase [Pelagibacterium sp.]|uniref:CCA tRNA nucleotidyltransferase n=1 Tax=Pelagibacterium sp. TaxID=1967288 RepID=UPI003A9058CE